VIGHWLLYMDVSLVLLLLEKETQAKASFDMAVSMNWIVWAVGAFYFGAHLLRQHQSKKG